MKAVIAHGAGDLRVEERAAGQVPVGFVRIRVTHGGICGSDIHYYKHGRVGAFALTEPLILGHEIVGTIAQDERVDGWAVGTPVTVHPAAYDLSVPEYRADRPNISADVRYLGSAAVTPHTQGAFSEFFTVDARQVRELPASLPLERGVLAEPLGVALHALNRSGGIVGRSVFISGAGPIGLLAARAAVVLGAQSVWIGDLLEHPLAVAELLGVSGTLQIGVDTIPARAFDVIIEASGAPGALNQAIRSARSGGTIVQVGMLPAAPSPYVLAELVSREIDLRGSFRFDEEIDEAIDLLWRDEVFGAVITHTIDADQAAHAFEIAADAARSSKVVLRMWESSARNERHAS